MLIEQVENTAKKTKSPKNGQKCGFEPNFLPLGPRFLHARMACSALPPLCGALENFTPNAYLHSSFYVCRIANPKNRSRLTRHDFAYVIFPRVQQRAARHNRHNRYLLLEAIPGTLMTTPCGPPVDVQGLTRRHRVAAPPCVLFQGETPNGSRLSGERDFRAELSQRLAGWLPLRLSA